MKLSNGLLDPDMSSQELKLHMGEMSQAELLTARAAIRWANVFALNALNAINAINATKNKD